MRDQKAKYPPIRARGAGSNPPRAVFAALLRRHAVSEWNAILWLFTIPSAESTGRRRPRSSLRDTRRRTAPLGRSRAPSPLRSREKLGRKCVVIASAGGGAACDAFER